MTLTSPLSAIEFLQSRSLADVIRDEIEAMILDGRFKPGGRVNELALAGRLRVSRGPVREALTALAAAGLLESIPNRGFFVRCLDETELFEVVEARAYVFAALADAAARRVGDAEVAALEALIGELEAAVSLGRVRDYYPINLRFHATLGEMAGNRRLAALYQSLARELHVQRYRALSAENMLAVSNAEHRAIVEAIAARDPAGAFAAAQAHVLNGFARMRRPAAAGGRPSRRGGKAAR